MRWWSIILPVKDFKELNLFVAALIIEDFTFHVPRIKYVDFDRFIAQH